MRLDLPYAHIYNPFVLSLTSKKLQPSTYQAEWEQWKQQLERWGLSSLTASVLESGGAFATLAAQGLYLAEPMLNIWMQSKHLHSLAQMLEDPELSTAFARVLRETE